MKILAGHICKYTKKLNQNSGKELNQRKQTV